MSKRKLSIFLVLICLMTVLLPTVARAEEIPADGFVQNQDGTYSYYLNGEMVTNQVVLHDGSYYGFDYNGIMYDDVAFDSYDENGNRGYYRAQAGGALYVNAWVQPYLNNEGAWNQYAYYYYGADGKAAEGITAVGGVNYYFEYDGRMATDTVVNLYGTCYAVDENGHATALNNNVWTEINGEWYYVNDDGIIHGPAQIDGVWYLFESSKLVVNDYYGMYDQELGTSVYYRSDAEGKLYINTWVQPYLSENDDTYYYYGEGGKAAYGYTNIGGVYYYFGWGGRMYEDTIVNSGEGFYAVDKNGYATALNNNAWTEVDGEWYYVKDNDWVDGPLQIDGVWYLFSSCRLLEDTYISWYDQDLGRSVYYRSDAEGKLYVNAWYYPSSTSRPYYYGENGASAYGYTQVDGVYYFFNYNGRLAYEGINSDANGVYYVDSNGCATVMANNAWTQIGDDWYYIKDNATVSGPLEIDGVLYLFSNSRLLKNGTTGIWDNDEGRQVYFRSNEDGVCYVNSWYYPDPDNKSNAWYYGEGGKSAFGLVTLDGRMYYFNAQGQMTKNAAVEYNGGYYVIDGEGNMTPMQNNAWTFAGTDWYYIKDGSICRGGVYNIDGAYYGFDSEGAMYSSTTFSFYDNVEEYRTVYYRAKSSGALYVNEWYKNTEGYWYFFGEGGKSAYGETTINGVEYYFNYNGWMMVDGSVWTEDGLKIADSSGTLHKAPEDGWIEVDGEWYYFENGEAAYGVQEVGGVKYLFIDGRMSHNEICWFWDDDAEESYAYCANANGVLYENAWAQPYLSEGDDDWCYFGENGRGAEGLVNIGGVDYLFENGWMIENGATYIDGKWYAADKDGHGVELADNAWTNFGGEWYYVQDGELCSYGIYEIDGCSYYFEYNGAMLVDESGYDYGFRTNASGVLYQDQWYWNAKESAWMYYDEDCYLVTNTLMEEDGIYYYFDYEGCTIKNDFRMYDGVAYSFDANGYGSKMADGWHWHSTDEVWYYISEGAFHEGLLQDSGSTYYCSYGEMLVDTKIYMSDDSGETVQYLLGKDGRMVTTPGWYTVESTHMYDAVAQRRYVYVKDTSGALAEGWQSVGGQWYYFSNGWMQHDTLVFDEQADGTLIPWWADSNGVCTRATGTGDFAYGQSTFFLENGVLNQDVWKFENGYWYYYNEYGYKVSGGVYEIDDVKYVFDANGRMWTNGWLTRNGSYCYADANGYAATGVTTIDGTQYLFSNYGYLLTNASTKLDDVWYFSDENGVLVSSGMANGWYSNGSNWFYIRNGSKVTGSLLDLDGVVYGFNYNGEMYSNTIANCSGYKYYFDASGVAQTGWIFFENNWYYADPDNMRIYRYRAEIDGSTYFFDYEGKMYTGTFIWGNQLITCDASGQMVNAVSIPEGYTYAKGQVYLMKDGEAYTGWLDNYYFRYGYMQYDGISEIEGDYYYFNVYGQCVKGQWYNTSYSDKYENWILARADGTLYQDEWYTPDGSTYYYFEWFNMVSDGVYYADGAYHLFDKNGVWLGEYNDTVAELSDGWHYSDGEWYYYHAGAPLCGFQYIGSDWYCFDEEGHMVSDGFYYDYNTEIIAYFTADGSMAEYVGWQIIDGEWVYFTENHHVRHGWVDDGNAEYYIHVYADFDDDDKFLGYKAEMLTDVYLTYNDDLYYFDASGVSQGDVNVQNGWFQDNEGDWFYFENGKLIQDEYRVIDGCGYAFNNGMMVTDTVYSWGNSVGYFGLDGRQVMTAGWHRVDGEWLYIDSTGEVYDGIHKIDGTVYYFRAYALVE